MQCWIRDWVSVNTPICRLSDRCSAGMVHKDMKHASLCSLMRFVDHMNSKKVDDSAEIYRYNLQFPSAFLWL